MALWTPAMKEALRNGATDAEMRAGWPSLTDKKIQSMRYVEKKAGRMRKVDGNSLVGPVMTRPDKAVGSFGWRDAIKTIQEMQELSSAAKSSQDTAKIVVATDEPIFCLFLSDAHLGDWATDYDLFMKITDEILETPNLYVGLLGDMVNLAINMRSVGEVTSGNLLPPELQAQFFADWLDDVKHKIMFATWSNHDIMREEKGTGISVFRGIQEKRVVYFNGIGHPDIHVGNEVYKFAVSHRFRGSSIENPCHSTMRYLRREGHDRELAAQGDSHVPGTAWFYHGPTKKVAINTGSFQTRSTYARRHYSLFTQPVMPGVVLFPDRHLMVPYDSAEAWLAA